MTSRRKMHGFTILEMVIAMILSVIVIALVYVALSLVQKEWSVFKEKQDSNTGLLLFKQALDIDIENAHYITHPHKHVLHFISGEKNIKWIFDSMAVRKQNDITDTFFIKMKHPRYEHIKLINGDSVVRKMTFHIQQPMEIDNVIFEKRYTSADLMSIN